MSLFLQLFINGIIAGSIYALVASGFSLIYSTNKFVHFAHGAVIAFAAYILFFTFNTLNFSFPFAIILTLLFSAFLGYLSNKVIYKPLRKRNASNVILLLSSFSLLILLESLILILFGADVKTIGYIKVAKGLSFFGAIITPLQIVIVATSLILLLVLYIVMKKTKLGKAMRAVSDNKDVAEIVGISSERIFSYAFMLGSVIAGVAGILIALEQNLEPTMGSHLIIKGFTASIIGGIGSVPGSIIGSYFLGLVENFGIWYLPSGYKDAIAFGILFLFLIFRPQGILGKK